MAHYEALSHSNTQNRVRRHNHDLKREPRPYLKQNPVALGQAILNHGCSLWALPLPQRNATQPAQKQLLIALLLPKQALGGPMPASTLSYRGRQAHYRRSGYQRKWCEPGKTISFSAANCSRAAVGSEPADSTKMRGVTGVESAWQACRSKVGGSTNLRPSCASTKSCTAGTTLSGLQG